jgi:ribonuclease Z
VGIEEPRAVLLSHFHADHTFGLASLILGRAVMDVESPALTVFGPVGTEAYLRQLLDFAWGEEMRQLAWRRLQLSVRELTGGEVFQVEGSQGSAYEMIHSSRFPCLGFVIERDGVRLGYTGDAEVSEGLHELLSACDHVIAEMTYDQPGPAHLSRAEVLRLMAAYPRVRFILTHLGTNGQVNGAVLARDFLTLRLPLD